MNSNLYITALSGLLIFILSQYVLELIIKPFIKYKKIKRKISNKLKYYANVISNPINIEATGLEIKTFENYQTASNEIRKLSCDIEAQYYYMFGWFRNFFIDDEVENTATLLIGI